LLPGTNERKERERERERERGGEDSDLLRVPGGFLPGGFLLIGEEAGHLILGYKSPAEFEEGKMRETSAA
jgi:hypothetical protein